VLKRKDIKMEAKTNDQKIMDLKQQIESKKKQIVKAKRFTPITNCSIEIDGIRHNIQVLTKEQLTWLLIKLNSYLMSAVDLELLATDCNVSGYNIACWMEDIKAKISYMSMKEEETKLKTMEEKLHKLLSNDKKVELEISEIESQLN